MTRTREHCVVGLDAPKHTGPVYSQPACPLNHRGMGDFEKASVQTVGAPRATPRVVASSHANFEYLRCLTAWRRWCLGEERWDGDADVVLRLLLSGF